MKRNIIQIDEALCNGCGVCIPSCHEGALQIIDGKARLISDLFCDGLGACLGHCPEGAITVIEREAEPYDERKVMEQIVPKGGNTILAHLRPMQHNPATVCGCQGSLPIDFTIDMEQVNEAAKKGTDPMDAPSELRQWPVQLHLLSPQASFFRNADMVLAADCVAFSMGNFHTRFLKGKSLAIACPKLDSNKESYVEKLTSMMADNGIRSLTVVMMEVPCCGGLMGMADIARKRSGQHIPMTKVIISTQGEVISEVGA